MSVALCCCLCLQRDLFHDLLGNLLYHRLFDRLEHGFFHDLFDDLLDHRFLHHGLELRLFFGGHLLGQVCHGVRTHSRLLGGRFGRFLFHFERLGDIFFVAVDQCFLCL